MVYFDAVDAELFEDFAGDAVEAGAGRVFATMIGHSAKAAANDGFRVTFVRGVEWAATGNVTLPPPPEMAQ